MPSYLVALDESEYAKAAFYAALGMMDKKRDSLYLVAVLKDITNYGLTTFANFILDQPEKEKGNLTDLLRKYGNLAKAAEVRLSNKMM